MAFYSFYLNDVRFTGCLTGSVRVKKKFLEYFLNRTSSTFLVGTRLSASRLKKKELTVSGIA